MTERKEYAIVRFFEQNGQCYKIDDVAEGSNLLQFIKDEERIEKKELYIWFSSLAAQLDLYQKSVKQGYGHVNPYAVIVNTEGKAALLDIEAKENGELLKRMQKKNFRSLFVKKGYEAGQQPKPGDDVFGFGKLLLFMMEKGKFETEFTNIEKIKLKRIIEKCTNKNGNARNIFKVVQKELNKMNQRNGAKRAIGMKMIVAGTAVTAGVGMFTVFNSHSVKEKQEIATAEEAIVLEDEERMALELGMLYYTELGDSTSTREILNNIEDSSEAAKLYLKILDYIQKGSGLEEKDWDTLWNSLKKEWERLGVENKLWYKEPVLEACRIRNTPESWEMICEIGEDAKENKVWNGIADNPEKETMICQYLAEAYEKAGEEEKALSEYESWKRLETEQEQLEHIYLKILNLSEKVKDVENEPEIMRTILEEAMQKVPTMEEYAEFGEWMKEYAEQEEVNTGEGIEGMMEEMTSETVE